MAKKRACKNSKLLVDDPNQCPPGDSLATSWQGRIHVVNAEKSEIAKRVNHEKNGEYAIKVR